MDLDEGSVGVSSLDEVLFRQEVNDEWVEVADFEKSAGLEEGSIGVYFIKLRKGIGGVTRANRKIEQWKAKGVHRVKTKRGGRQVWWITFRGDGVDVVDDWDGRTHSPAAPALVGDEKETRCAGSGGEDRSHWGTTEVFTLALHTSTEGFYLLANELTRYLRVDERILRDFLAGRSITGRWLPRGQSSHHESYMRTLGIYRRMFGNQKAYLLLGVGPIALLDDLKRVELEAFLGEPPPGIFWSQRKTFVYRQPAEVAASQAEVVKQSILLGIDIGGSLKCDECNRLHLGDWRFMRLWTKNIDMPGLENETIGLAFECTCGRITIGAPLPKKTSGESRERWSSADLAIQCVLNGCPMVGSGAAALLSTTASPRRPLDLGRAGVFETNEEAASSTGLGGGAIRTTNERRSGSSSGLAPLSVTRAGVTEGNDGERRSTGSRPPDTGETSGRRSTIDGTSRRKAASSPRLRPERGHEVTEKSLLDLVGHVHRTHTECPGIVKSTGVNSNRGNAFGFRAKCTGCAAQWGRMGVNEPCPLSHSLGVLLAGSTFDYDRTSSALSDVGGMSRSTFYRHRTKVCKGVDALYNKTMREQMDEIRNDPRRKVMVDAKNNFFIKHRDDLNKRIENGRCGVQEHRYENMSEFEMAVNLLASKRARGEEPKFNIVGDKVEACAVEGAFDGAYRNRNGKSNVMNIIMSVNLLEENAQGRKTVPFTMVSYSRDLGDNASLHTVCTLTRDGGRCHVHGTEDEWEDVVQNGTDEDREKAIGGNCLSGSGARCALNAAAAERQGMRQLCLTLQLEGIHCSKYAHDQDTSSSVIVHNYFPEAVECLDRAHVQKNAKKNTEICASGNGDRLSRLFAHAFATSRGQHEDYLKRDGGNGGFVAWHECFAYNFAHVPFHLQGDHSMCTEGCAGRETLVVNEDVEAGGTLPSAAAVPDRESGDIFAGLCGYDPGVPSNGATAEEAAEGDTYGEDTEIAGPHAATQEGHVPDVPGQESMGVGEVHKARKATLAYCRRSAATALSAKRSATDSSALFTKKMECWGDVRCQIYLMSRGSEHDGGNVPHSNGEHGGADDVPGSGMEKGSGDGGKDTEASACLLDLLRLVKEVAECCQENINLVAKEVLILDFDCGTLYPSTSAADGKEFPGSFEGLEGWGFENGSEEPTFKSTTNAPAVNVTSTKIKAAKEAYIAKVVAVRKAEKRYRDSGGRVITVPVTNGRNTQWDTLEHIAWTESRCWAFFSHCSNARGATAREEKPCPACDVMVLVLCCISRSNQFCHTVGTNAIESYNGSIAAVWEKRSDFAGSAFARSHIGVLNRVMPGGLLEVSSKMRNQLGLQPLSAESEAVLRDERASNIIGSSSADHVVTSVAKRKRE